MRRKLARLAEPKAKTFTQDKYRVSSTAAYEKSKETILFEQGTFGLIAL